MSKLLHSEGNGQQNAKLTSGVRKIFAKFISESQYPNLQTI